MELTARLVTTFFSSKPHPTVIAPVSLSRFHDNLDRFSPNVLSVSSICLTNFRLRCNSSAALSDAGNRFSKLFCL